MKLIYLSLMSQRLKDSRNKLGRRRSKAELSSLKVELVQKWWIWASIFFFLTMHKKIRHGFQGDKTLWHSNDPLGFHFEYATPCHKLVVLLLQNYQKWKGYGFPKMGIFFTKTSKSYLNRLVYCVNLPRNMCT